MPEPSTPSSPPDPTHGARTADQQLFQPPPVVERRAFTHTDPWRVLRIMGEFVGGFDEMADVRLAASVFGSARTLPSDPMYALAVETARLIGESGIAVITGAGPGIMEAANRGAREAGALSIGFNIELPHEQGVNPYVDRHIQFRYFFVRKTMLVKYSSAFIFFPGGFGTLDELYEALTLKQTHRVRDIPVVLVGRAYWKGLVEWMRNRMAAEQKIDATDVDLLQVTDDPKEVADIVRRAALQRQSSEPPGADV